MGATFILTKNEGGTFGFTFQMLDGQVILTSQGYTDKEAAIRRMNAVRNIAARGQYYEPRTAENGQSYLLLKNRKKEVIGQSEMYPDSESLQRVIALARANVRGAAFEDLTGGK